MRLAKQIVVHFFGGPDVLSLVDMPVPVAGPGQVLIRVEAAGVLYGDVMRRTDRYLFPTPLPYTPGTEVAGVIEDVGPGVGLHKRGDRVVSFVQGGGYAQFAIAEAASVVSLPARIDFAHATALLAQGSTAYLLTYDAAVIRGKSVFIESAAGGVGTQMVQLAKAQGATFIAGSASTQAKRDYARRNGVDWMVDPADPAWYSTVLEVTDGRGIDVGYESSGACFEQLLKCLSPFGTLVKFGRGVNECQALDPAAVVRKNQSIRGFYLPGYKNHPKSSLLRDATSHLIKSVLANELTVDISDRFALKDAYSAHAMIEGRRTVGKVVLEPWRAADDV
ncbi:quinone oxidoreductase family protein [Paraburkholderia caledonica]|uniref:NADPH2:quinone reductase n=1 Tax=Paraburkholderia caledonica TaxID=134536 RepID=A0ABU1KYX6_9BURK|nr:zinc-binding dehydrogenase [Paraburkholderia caledonica]MDR6376184.1 NADPH2:quinone reductase [Paraburkholderia caledonica]